GRSRVIALASNRLAWSWMACCSAVGARSISITCRSFAGHAEPALGDDEALHLVRAAAEALHRGDGVEPLEAAMQRRRLAVGRELTRQAADGEPHAAEGRVQPADLALYL